MKPLIRIIMYFLLFISSLLLSAGYIFYTPAGLNTALKLLPFISRNTLSISQGSGILAKQFDLKNIVYKKNNTVITIADIKITWQFSEFTHATVTASISPLTYNNFSIPESHWQGEFFLKENHIKIQTLNGTVVDKTEIAHLSLSLIDTLNAQWNIQIANLNDFLPGSAGQFSSQGSLNDQALQLSANLSRLRYKNNQIQKFSLAVNGTLKNKQLTVTIKPNDFIFYSQTFNHWFLRTPARLELTDDHATLHPFTLQGSQGSFILSGAWKKDSSWQLNESGKLQLPEYTISPAFDFHETGNKQKISYAGTILSGKGFLNVKGHTQNNSTQLSITGSNFLAVNSPEYYAWASPDLVLKNQGKGWNLTGTLDIPKARVNIPTQDNAVVTLPKDVVFVDTQNDHTALPLYSNVELHLGNDIKVDVQGLSGEIQGNLTLHDTPEQLTTGNGRLDIIHGSYQLYGQTLKIKYGNLIFNSSVITNPGLHIQAVKKIRVSNLSGATSVSTLSPTLNNLSGATTVGANITGTLEEPQITLFSSPITLSQTDILSYLVLGHPASAASPLDAQLLLQATTSMKSDGGQVEQIRRELQHLFGIDKLNIESINYIDPTAKSPTLNQTTAVVLGKALSPHLYLSYSAGLMGTVNIFTIKYTISKRWLLQSTTSTFGSGADIFAMW